MDACLLTCPAAGMATSTAVAGGSWGLGAASCGHLQPGASTQGLLQALECSPCRCTQRWLHSQSRCPTWRGQEECRRVHGSRLLAGERRRKALRPCPGGGRLGGDAMPTSPAQCSSAQGHPESTAQPGACGALGLVHAPEPLRPGHGAGVWAKWALGQGKALRALGPEQQRSSGKGWGWSEATVAATRPAAAFGAWI